MPGSYLPETNEFDPQTDDFVISLLTKERRYLHFDLPLSKAERQQTTDFSRETSRHRFYPLLGFASTKRVLFKDSSGTLRQKTKVREIRYASHKDAAYLQAYTEYLSPKYERSLTANGLQESVLAYRRGGNSNIHHAKDLFDEISFRRECLFVGLDISGFFDTINHSTLKNELVNILANPHLEGHHWAVFRNTTRYSYVNQDDLDRVLGKRRRRLGRICTNADFLRTVRGRSSGLIQTNLAEHGIPQGLPISGLYANIYMREFDEFMKNLMSDIGGSYRRYSDDIALILPPQHSHEDIIGTVKKILADLHLCLSSEKTDITKFSGGKSVDGTVAQYLGFTYDGHRTLIRDSSLNAYRSKMRRGIRATLISAKQQGIHPDQVFRRKCISRYTHAGKRRNFIKYAYRAADILDAPEIRAQVKRNMHWFKKTWRSETTKVFGDAIESSW